MGFRGGGFPSECSVAVGFRPSDVIVMVVVLSVSQINRVFTSVLTLGEKSFPSFCW